ncbi:Protein KIAA0556 [Hondaea fermentalgiana]|uniref:Protein KIAA0556 n=1 Tax=Hondaea fermentalgiana TaxID=2315210 RepID=A0A2R5GCC2_9STRA|nr:Protein KIAA0556 [Hondaea fermentalgiana]|eukprot:GBG25811.1 Protein KIAA0556 [Hondaea fermentalgiana]
MDDNVHRNLRELQERNRLRREEEKRRVSEEEKRKRELERGFVTHFSGANSHSRAKPNHPLATNSRTTSSVSRRRNVGHPVKNAASKADSRRHSSVLGNVGSQVAAQRNRRQWGRVVEPEFLKPANLPPASRVTAKSSTKSSLTSTSNSETLNDENSLSTNAQPSARAHVTKSGKSSRPRDPAALHESLNERIVHVDDLEDYPDDFETMVESGGEDDGDLQSLPEILEILESPQRSSDDAYEASLLSKSMSLSMSMSMSMGLNFSRLAAWRRGRGNAEDKDKDRTARHRRSPSNSSSSSCNGRSPDIDDLEAGRRVHRSPGKRSSGVDVEKKGNRTVPHVKVLLSPTKDNLNTSALSAAAQAKAKGEHHKVRSGSRSRVPSKSASAPVDLDVSSSFLSPLDETSTHFEAARHGQPSDVLQNISEAQSPKGLSSSFIRDKPVTVRSSPIYNRSLGASAASLSGLLESSLSMSDEQWERALEGTSIRARGSNRASSANADSRALSKSMCLDRSSSSKTRSAGHLGSRTQHMRVAPRGRRLRFNFVETWGDIYYMGLTGLALLVRKEDGNLTEKYPLRKRIKACPPDINVSGHSGDPRTLDKVIDGWNNTSSEHHMWLIEFNPNEDHTLEIDLGSRHFALAGIRVWNYNKNIEDTRRGVRTAHVTLDGMALSPPQGLTFRRSPGTDEVDFGQTILFEMEADAAAGASDALSESVIAIEEKEMSGADKKLAGPRSSSASNRNAWLGGDGFRDVLRPPQSVPTGARGAALLHQRLQQDWEVPLLPCGFVLRFDFLASQGDPQWVGLDGLELYDAAGAAMDVRSLGGRLLAPGKGEMNPAWRKPWSAKLAPPDAARPARLYVVFDRPVTLGAITFANFSAQPARGVGEVAVFLDSLIIFHGELRSAQVSRTQSVVFTPQSSVLGRVEQDGDICYCGEKEQSVMFIDNYRSV